MGRPSVAVVVLDTVRYDLFKRYFEWLPGLRFENACSTSHWTVPAHASLLTGYYASELGVHGKSRSFDCPQSSIAERLNAEGYKTRLWTANMQIHEWDGWDRGFDHVLGPRDIHPLADNSVDWEKFAQQTERMGLSQYAAAINHALTTNKKKLLHRYNTVTIGYRIVLGAEHPQLRSALTTLISMMKSSFCLI